MLILRGRAIQERVGYLVANGGGAPVEQVAGGGEGLRPVGGRHGCVEEHGAHRVVECTNDTLSLAVLWRGVRAREAQKDATGCKERKGGVIDELHTIICLQTLHRMAKLCASISNELNNVLVHVRLASEGKRPRKVCVITQNDQII